MKTHRKQFESMCPPVYFDYNKRSKGPSTEQLKTACDACMLFINRNDGLITSVDHSVSVFPSKFRRIVFIVAVATSAVAVCHCVFAYIHRARERERS